MNHYEAKQEARRQRLEARAGKLRDEAHRRIHEATKEGAMPPMGEPIKVGHHSEKKHRAMIARSDMNMRKGVEALSKADHHTRSAEAVGSGGISSDDPDAIAKLCAELAGLEQRQSHMIAANKDWRANADKPSARPHAAFSLSNNSANIRRVKVRIADLERKAQYVRKETERPNGVRVVENVEANRFQIFFPSKPAPEARALLKQAGFRWAPSEGAWQRHLGNAARYHAEYALAKIETAQSMEKIP